MHAPVATKFRLWFILGSVVVALADPLHAQTIQKCTRPDGSVLYQQDVCPPGTNSKLVATESTVSNSLTLLANSNHQYSTTITINGITVPGYVDTGATYVSLSTETANRMHISLNDAQGRYMQTANGIVLTGHKVVSVLKVGKFELYNVEIAILADTPTLIGMSALSQLKFSNENGNMVLTKR
jgi:aspartyl protease family protein